MPSHSKPGPLYPSLSRRCVVAGGLGGAMLSACGPTPTPAAGAFEGRLAALTTDLFEAQPEAALLAGAPGARRDRLLDRSPAAVDLARAASLRRAAQWRGGVDRVGLDEPNRQTFDVIDAHLAALADASGFGFGRLDPIYGFSPFAADHLNSATVTLPWLLNAALGSADIAEQTHHIQRLKLVAPAIDGELETARTDMRAGFAPPAMVLRRLQEAVAATLAVAPSETSFVSTLRTRLGTSAQNMDTSTAPLRETTRAAKLLAEAEHVVANSIFPAYRRAYAAFGELLLRAPEEISLGRMTHGPAYYQASLTLHVGRGANASDLHRTSLARLKTLTAQLDMMQRSQGLANGAASERLAALAADPRFLYADAPESRAQIINDIRREISRVAPLLPRILQKPSADPIQVLAAGPSLADGYLPASLDGKRPAILAVDVRAPAQTPRFVIAALAHHDGVPGRHTAATAQTKGNLPTLRKMIPNAAARGGWANYAEQLADELGAYDSAPYARIGHLRSQIQSAARAVADTGLHGQNWTNNQALAFLTGSVGVSPAAAAAMIADCAASPGVACAEEAGRAEITRLRDEARASLGARFDLRDFHEAVLSVGQAPLPLMTNAVTAWIAKPR